MGSDYQKESDYMNQSQSILLCLSQCVGQFSHGSVELAFLGALSHFWGLRESIVSNLDQVSYGSLKLVILGLFFRFTG